MMAPALLLQVVPLYCFNPCMFVETPWGHSKLGPHGAQFRLEAVNALRGALRSIGSDLLVCNGKPEDAIAGAACSCLLKELS